MEIALKILTWMFLAGLAGSSIVAVLFIVDLLRVTMGSEPKTEQRAHVEG